MGDLDVPPATFDSVRRWLQEVTNPDTFQVGYTALGTGKVVIQGKNEAWDGHEAVAAVGMVCRVALDGSKSDPVSDGGARLLLADPPAYRELKVDYYYWYYGTLALFHTCGPDAAACNPERCHEEGAHRLPSQGERGMSGGLLGGRHRSLGLRRWARGMYSA